MKNQRTKIQEVINLAFGYARFAVRPEDIPIAQAYFARVLPRVLGEEYVEALVLYLTGTPLNHAQKQQKFHTMFSLRQSLGSACVEEPNLPKIVIDKELYNRAELGAVLFGVHGDPKVYHLGGLPQPEVGRKFTQAQVKAIVEGMNSGTQE